MKLSIEEIDLLGENLTEVYGYGAVYRRYPVIKIHKSLLRRISSVNHKIMACNPPRCIA